MVMIYSVESLLSVSTSMNLGPGFYKNDNNNILFNDNYIHFPMGDSLIADEHENYTYPIEGWSWYDNQPDAETALGIQILDNNLDINSLIPT